MVGPPKPSVLPSPKYICAVELLPSLLDFDVPLNTCTPSRQIVTELELAGCIMRNV